MRKGLDVKGQIEKEEQEQIKEENEQKQIKNVLLTNGFNFEGYKIQKYMGIISGEVVLGTGFLSEFSASVSDMFGTQSNVFSEKMSEAKQAAMDILIRKAVQNGANAIIGMDFDYITFKNNMIAVSANGTAVIIEKDPVE